MVVLDMRCICGGPHFVFFLWTPLAGTMKEKFVLCSASTRQTGSALTPSPTSLFRTGRECHPNNWLFQYHLCSLEPSRPGATVTRNLYI